MARLVDLALGVLCLGSRRRLPDGVSKILVVEYWRIGDAVMLTPFLGALRQRYPSAEIVVAAHPRTHVVFGLNGAADRVVSLQPPWAEHHSRIRKYNPVSPAWVRFIRQLIAVRRRGFDLALSGRADVRDNVILWLSGAKYRIGYGFSGGGRFLTTCVSPDVADTHRSRLWLGLLRDLGGRDASTATTLTPAVGDVEAVRMALRAHGLLDGRILVGIHPGASNPLRSWGMDRFREVARRLGENRNVSIVWFDEPAAVSQPLGDGPDAVVIREAVPRFLAALSLCDLLLCNDSGPMHLAGAVGVPVVAIFGPNFPEWVGPRGADDAVVVRRDVWCRPCNDYCVFSEPYCLRLIPVGQVLAAVSTLIKKIQDRRSSAPVSNESVGSVWEAEQAWK